MTSSSPLAVGLVLIFVLCTILPVDSQIDPESRIIGGEEATEGEFPHQIRLTYPTPSNELISKLCGGSIISPYYILTAGHCIGNVASKLDIVAGVADFRGAVQPNILKAAEAFIHPCYNKTSPFGFNDIAIIKLADPLPLNKNTIKIIEFDKMDLAKNGQRTKAIGWGSTIPTPTTISQILKKTVLDIKEELCAPTPYQGESQICVYYKGGALCQGDSGGPLLCDDGCGIGRNVLCGVASLSGSSSAPNKINCMGPGIYTRVYHYRKWIKAMVGGAKDSEEGCVGTRIAPRTNNAQVSVDDDDDESDGITCPGPDQDEKAEDETGSATEAKEGSSSSRSRSVKSNYNRQFNRICLSLAFFSSWGRKLI